MHRPNLNLVLCLGLVVPSAITWLYFVGLAEADPPWPHAAYVGGKLAQFGLAVLWWRLGGGGVWPGGRVRAAHLVEGAAAGAAIAALGVAAVHLWLGPSGLLAPLVETSLQRKAAFGIDAPAAYVTFAAAYALIHSGIEEWYWRGFVLAGLRRLVAPRAAALLAALAFGAHHLVLLAAFFGGVTPLVGLLAGCVVAGGLIWSAMRERHDHLYGAWLSHGLVDAAIFAVGWRLSGGA